MAGSRANLGAGWAAAAILLAASALLSRPLSAESLPGTEPLTIEGDIASQIVDGAGKFLRAQTQRAGERRERHWRRDLISWDAYRASVAPNRRRLGAAIGFDASELEADRHTRPAGRLRELVARAERYEVFAVSWPVLRGVEGEGLLAEPAPDAYRGIDIVAIPDADQTPEALLGLEEGVPPQSQFARRLAESGCRVLVPCLIDRGTRYSTTLRGSRQTSLSHRELLYRPAFELGRHIIGYEVAKVVAGLECFRGKPSAAGVAGYGEGGLIALHAAALDERVAAVLVSGHFDSRQEVWREPIYRNVFRLLDEFGDAEIASLVAPRPLLVEAARAPEVVVPPGTGGGPGRLTTPLLASVRAELERARSLVRGPAPAARVELVETPNGSGSFGSDAALGSFLDALKPGAALAASSAPPRRTGGAAVDAAERMHRQVRQIDTDTQQLLAESAYTRQELWKGADRASRSPDAWRDSVKPYRDLFRDQVIGRFEIDKLPPRPRSRKIYDEPAFTGWEVVLDVFPDVIAYGVLLLPKGIAAGERRPVVVCQHGLEGRPTDVADPKLDHPAYHRFAVRLAERGFITFAPQNLYIFGDRFRTLQRQANPLGKTLFSVIVPQHEAITDWLASQDWVDPDRIGFYGLSYGGKTAMRVPALVERYALSICSADFNEWIWKNASTRSPYSYVSTGEYEIFEFNLGMTFNYAEMAALIAPRPFMVERGHRDGVAPDETVAYEYAKIRLLYADLRISDRTEIEFFDGPHTIHGKATFAFLHRHLRWPEPAAAK